ncbi:Nin one binding Zn-ribbon like-domain-containing protein [Dipodascopsis uninucleata]
MATTPKVSCLVLDAGPLILNGYSALVHLADEFITTTSVYSEIKDERARQNLILWEDRLNLRQPSIEYIQIVSDFAKKTGDYSVLSAPDLHILALTYQLECERNNGDWRLRKVPGQLKINKAVPDKATESIRVGESSVVDRRVNNFSIAGGSGGSSTEKSNESENRANDSKSPQGVYKEPIDIKSGNLRTEDDEWTTVKAKAKHRKNVVKRNKSSNQVTVKATISPSVKSTDQDTCINKNESKTTELEPDKVKRLGSNIEVNPLIESDVGEQIEDNVIIVGEDIDEDDDEGWITPETLLYQQVLDGTLEVSNAKDLLEKVTVIKVGVATNDFAMQNVAMQIGLNVINPQSGKQIKKIRSWMLRCHACFHLTSPSVTATPKHFCPKCGGATLLRCTVTTSADTGKLQIHLKKNFQWTHRGNRYSLPTPQSRQNRKTGGETNEDALLRGDQKEYLRAVKNDQWHKRHSEKLMQEWIGNGGIDAMGSPFLNGSYKRDPTKSGVRVGKGRYVNERQRKSK